MASYTMLNELDSFLPRQTFVWVKTLLLDQTLEGKQVVNLVVNYQHLARAITDFVNIDDERHNLSFPFTLVDQLDWIDQTLFDTRVCWAMNAHTLLS